MFCSRPKSFFHFPSLGFAAASMLALAGTVRSTPTFLSDTVPCSIHSKIAALSSFLALSVSSIITKSYSVNAPVLGTDAPVDSLTIPAASPAPDASLPLT